MKTFYLLAILLCSGIISASEKTILEQITVVNSNWRNVPAYNSAMFERKQLHLEKELIQTHLKFVIEYLKQGGVNLAIEQKNARAKCIDILESYRQAGAFPINTYHNQRQPYFIDNYGTYCAVGFLLKETGFDEVAQRIHREMNYAYIREIPGEYLAGWSKEHGFSIQELALIQPTYAPFVYCNNDILYVGKNTPTTGYFLRNDIVERYMCNSVPGEVIVNILDSTDNGLTSIVQLPADTLFVYSPAANFTGTDSLMYEVVSSIPGCGTGRDTAAIIFHVLSTPGDFISFIPGDANYDGKISNMDFLMFIKNLGEQGPVRDSIVGNCNVTYSNPWNTSFLNSNIASIDANGDGRIDLMDYDASQSCFALVDDYPKFGSVSSLYSIAFSAHDTLLTAGDSVWVSFTVRDSNGLGPIVPIKALAMEFYGSAAPRLDLLKTNTCLNALPYHEPLVQNKEYAHLVKVGLSYDEFIYTGCTRTAYSPVQSTYAIMSDSFLLVGKPIIEDSIHSNGYVGLGLRNIVALDASNQIIRIKNTGVSFKTQQGIAGVKNTPGVSFTVYPNPANLSANILIDAALMNSTLKLKDVTGKELLDAKINQPDFVLETGSLPAGIYFVTLTAPDGRTGVQKLVKQ